MRLPKAFRFEGSEVLVEKRGDEVVLKAMPRPELRSVNDVARYFANHFPEVSDFPDPLPRPLRHERPILEW